MIRINELQDEDPELTNILLLREISIRKLYEISPLFEKYKKIGITRRKISHKPLAFFLSEIEFW